MKRNKIIGTCLLTDFELITIKDALEMKDGLRQ